MKTFSIQQYAEMIGFKGENPTLECIQEFAEECLNETLWDYPIEELQDILDEIEETKKKFVFVNTEIGLRICEIL